MSAMLCIKQLEYGYKKQKLVVVSEARMHAGQLVALLGPNGAGKSTLLRLLAREVTGSGEICLHNKQLADWPRLQLARHLAVLPQNSQLAFPFTAEEVVALGLTPLRMKRQEGKRRVQHMMQQTDCIQFSQQSFVNLSGGERQRVQLARVLLQLSQAEQAPLLLLDEPTSAQDIRQQHAILQLVQGLAHKQGYAVLAILHDINHALRYSDGVWLMAQGELLAQGSPQQCLTEQQIENVWGYRPRMLHAGSDHMLVY